MKQKTIIITYALVFFFAFLSLMLIQKERTVTGAAIRQQLIVLDATALEYDDADMISCQIDCTMNDGIFHEECIGFNSCEDSTYLKDKDYCEKDEDCVVYFGCCTSQAGFLRLKAVKFCDVSNKFYDAAHEFSCNALKCTKRESCRLPDKISCVQNECQISAIS